MRKVWKREKLQIQTPKLQKNPKSKTPKASAEYEPERRLEVGASLELRRLGFGSFREAD